MNKESLKSRGSVPLREVVRRIRELLPAKRSLEGQDRSVHPDLTATIAFLHSLSECPNKGDETLLYDFFVSV